ncbi:MAG TPA: hypothetical protein VFH77_06860 [Streptomyces sp.]|nr:hypothetical protein [Streptomyces sp.]
MPTPPTACTGTSPQYCEWDDPLTRLLLLLEIAREPSWLRDAVAARAGRPQTEH